MTRTPILLAAAILLVSPSVVYAGNKDTGSAGTPPPGSYQQSCINISVSGSTLYALCRKSTGSLNNAALYNYASAGGQDIANCEGALTIGRCPSAYR